MTFHEIEKIEDKAKIRSTIFGFTIATIVFFMLAKLTQANSRDPEDEARQVFVAFGCLTSFITLVSIFYQANKAWLMRDKKKATVELSTIKSETEPKVRIQPGIKARWIVIASLLAGLTTHYAPSLIHRLPFSVKIEKVK